MPSLLNQRGDVLDDARAHDGVERGKRLVHQEKLRHQRQHLRERDALSLPAAQVARIALARSRQPNPAEPMVGLHQRALARMAVEFESERHVVACRLPGQQRVVLEQHADLGAA